MTKFEQIYKIFLSTIQDYHIKNLFNIDFDLGDDLLETFLYKAISKFNNCIKNIYDIDKVEKSFKADLDIKEITILSDLMVLSWIDWNNNNIIDMNLNLNDNNFKRYSDEKNLREKTMYADRLREKVSQDMTDYGLYHTPFKEWASGNYEL